MPTETHLTYTNRTRTVRLNDGAKYATLVGLNEVGWVIWASIVLHGEMAGMIQKHNLSVQGVA